MGNFECSRADTPNRPQPIPKKNTFLAIFFLKIHKKVLQELTIYFWLEWFVRVKVRGFPYVSHFPYLSHQNKAKTFPIVSRVGNNREVFVFPYSFPRKSWVFLPYSFPHMGSSAEQITSCQNLIFLPNLTNETRKSFDA